MLDYAMLPICLLMAYTLRDALTCFRHTYAMLRYAAICRCYAVADIFSPRLMPLRHADY